MSIDTILVQNPALEHHRQHGLWLYYQKDVWSCTEEHPTAVQPYREVESSRETCCIPESCFIGMLFTCTIILQIEEDHITSDQHNMNRRSPNGSTVTANTRSLRERRMNRHILATLTEPIVHGTHRPQENIVTCTYSAKFQHPDKLYAATRSTH